MLGAASYIGFIPVRDLGAAQAFYVGTLGLVVRERTTGMLMVDAGGTMLWITAVEAFSPQPFTVAGWRVRDLDDTLDRLAQEGVETLRYPDFDQDARGVWHAPGGNRVAWFSDPDGNVLSLTQFVGTVVDEFWV